MAELFQMAGTIVNFMNVEEVQLEEEAVTLFYTSGRRLVVAKDSWPEDYEALLDMKFNVPYYAKAVKKWHEQEEVTKQEVDTLARMMKYRGTIFTIGRGFPEED